MNYAENVLLKQKELLEKELEHLKGDEFIVVRQKYRDINYALNVFKMPMANNWRSFENIASLKMGDIVRHKGSLESCVVNANYGDRATATITKDITNPDEWELLTSL